MKTNKQTLPYYTRSGSHSRTKLGASGACAEVRLLTRSTFLSHAAFTILNRGELSLCLPVFRHSRIGRAARGRLHRLTKKKEINSFSLVNITAATVLKKEKKVCRLIGKCLGGTVFGKAGFVAYGGVPFEPLRQEAWSSLKGVTL